MSTLDSDDRIAFSTGAGVSAAGIRPMFYLLFSITLLSTHYTINTVCVCVCVCVCAFETWVYLSGDCFCLETPEPYNQTTLHQGLCNTGKCVYA